MIAEHTRVLVRPRRSLLLTALVSITAAFIPIFGVLYWFAIDHGSWQTVALVNLAAVLIGGLLVLRQLSVRCEVTDTELRGNGIFTPMVHVPLERIASVLLVPTYIGQDPRPVTQLLVRDAAGRRVFRMRGSFWSHDDLRALADALPVYPTEVDQPVPVRDFFRQYPGSAYWFEDKPALRVGLIVGLLVVGLAVVWWVMSILGLPLGVMS